MDADELVREDKSGKIGRGVVVVIIQSQHIKNSLSVAQECEEVKKPTIVTSCFSTHGVMKENAGEVFIEEEGGGSSCKKAVGI